jgi:mRNA deadenylase 3'-5' endonuclease subunit Ccr4
MKKQKSKTTKKSTPSKKRNNEAAEKPSSWVEEHLDWLSNEESPPTVKNESSSSSSNDTGVSIISWNVLADAYCNRRSHQQLPLKFQRHVFDRPQRQHHVRQTLTRLATSLAPDLLALQEVDPPLEVPACMNALGYEGIETTTSPGGKDGRVDACALYYRQDKWKCIEHQIVRLDDLAIQCSKNANNNNNNNNNTSTTAATTTTHAGNLQGVQSTFVRKNVALLVRLEHLQSHRPLVVAVMHLYWNPCYEYVKVRIRNCLVIVMAHDVC